MSNYVGFTCIYVAVITHPFPNSDVGSVNIYKYSGPQEYYGLSIKIVDKCGLNYVNNFVDAKYEWDQMLNLHPVDHPGWRGKVRYLMREYTETKM